MKKLASILLILLFMLGSLSVSACSNDDYDETGPFADVKWPDSLLGDND